MRKFLMALSLIGAALAAGPVFAQASFLEDLLPPAAKATPDATCKGDCGCSNFTGAWIGACAVNGKETAQPANLNIDQQTCHHITINKDRLAVGGFKTYTISLAQDLCIVGTVCSVSGPESEAGESVADWNKDHNVLTVSAHSGSRLLDRPIAAQQISGTIQLDGAHLLIDATGTNATGAAVTVSCSFEK